MLVSIGRRPNAESIGLENIGVLTERGTIVTDEYCRTSVSGVWAAGGVNVNRCSPTPHIASGRGKQYAWRQGQGKYSSIPAVITQTPRPPSAKPAAQSGLPVASPIPLCRRRRRYYCPPALLGPCHAPIRRVWLPPEQVQSSCSRLRRSARLSAMLCYDIAPGIITAENNIHENGTVPKSQRYFGAGVFKPDIHKFSDIPVCPV